MMWNLLDLQLLAAFPMGNVTPAAAGKNWVSQESWRYYFNPTAG